MLLKGYTIYDSKALQYHSPWFMVSDGAAVRAFQDLVNDHNSTLSRHPGDYSLWFMGTYDDNKGFLHSQVPLVHIIDAQALVALSPAPLFESPAGTDTGTAERDRRIIAARTVAEVDQALNGKDK